MTSVKELDLLCSELKDLRTLKKEIKAKLDEVEKEYKSKQSEIIKLLEELGKTENEGSFGKVKVVQREYYKMNNKDEVFNWLRERGDFESLATVNANTFSSYVKKLVEQKREEGDFVWTPPGVEDATSDYTYLRISEK